jgi:hypothetical protein
MLVSDRFWDGNAREFLKTEFNRTYPTRHFSMDGFLVDGGIQDLQAPDLVKELSGTQFRRRLEVLTGTKQLIHVPRQVIRDVKPSLRPMMTNGVHRHGTLWKRYMLALFLDASPEGNFEIWHYPKGKSPELVYWVPPVENRLVFWETHPETFISAGPSSGTESYRYFTMQFYTHDMPEWRGHGLCETVTERPIDG